MTNMTNEYLQELVEELAEKFTCDSSRQQLLDDMAENDQIEVSDFSIIWRAYEAFVQSKKSISQNNQSKTNKTIRTNPFATGREKGKIQAKHLSLFQPPEFIIERFGIQKGHLTLLVAEGGSCKTFLSSYMALCVSLGKSFVNAHSVQQGRVLHVDLEQSEDQTMQRYSRLAFGMDVDSAKKGFSGAGQNLLDREVWNFKLDCFLKSNESSEEEMFSGLVDAISGYDLVIIDSLKKLSCADENSSEIEIVCGMLKRAANSALNSKGKKGVAIVLIHHKGKGKSSSVQTGRGHSSIYDSLDNQIDMESSDGNICIRSAKSRDAKKFADLKVCLTDVGDIVPGFNRTEGITFVEQDSSVIDGQKRNVILGHLNILDGNSGKSQKELRSLFGLNYDNYKKAIADLIEQGLVKEIQVKNTLQYEITKEGKDFIASFDQEQ